MASDAAAANSGLDGQDCEALSGQEANSVGMTDRLQQQHRNSYRRQSNEDLIPATLRPRSSALSVPERSRNRPASLSPFRHKKDASGERWRPSERSDFRQWHRESNDSSPAVSPVQSAPSWRKKYARRSSSSSVVAPTYCSASSRTVAVESNAGGASASSNHTAKSSANNPLNLYNVAGSHRRNSQPATFSLPQLVRRSLQPLISSSPSTEVDDTQPESLTKLRHMKCKQVGKLANSLPTSPQMATQKARPSGRCLPSFESSRLVSVAPSTAASREHCAFHSRLRAAQTDKARPFFSSCWPPVLQTTVSSGIVNSVLAIRGLRPLHSPSLFLEIHTCMLPLSAARMLD